jgi:hypothetical protein
MGNGLEGQEPPTVQPQRALTEAELRKRFFYHPPRDDEAKLKHAQVSNRCFDLAIELCDICYPGRQLSLALTALEEVRMRANASIACDDPRD